MNTVTAYYLLYVVLVILCIFVVRQQKKFQLNPESYNGAIRDNYSWSQSITDLDVHVMVSFKLFSVYQ